MKRQPAKVRVNIYEDCNVDCEGANVSKLFKDEIEWFSTGEGFTVRFLDNSPFADAVFDVPAGGSKRSGPVLDTALFVTYHYEIRRIGSASAAADPDVNVKH